MALYICFMSLILMSLMVVSSARPDYVLNPTPENNVRQDQPQHDDSSPVNSRTPDQANSDHWRPEPLYKAKPTLLPSSVRQLPMFHPFPMHRIPYHGPIIPIFKRPIYKKPIYGYNPQPAYGPPIYDGPTQNPPPPGDETLVPPPPSGDETLVPPPPPGDETLVPPPPGDETLVPPPPPGDETLVPPPPPGDESPVLPPPPSDESPVGVGSLPPVNQFPIYAPPPPYKSLERVQAPVYDTPINEPTLGN